MKPLPTLAALAIVCGVAWWVGFHGVSGPAICADWERYVVTGFMLAGGLAYLLSARYKRDSTVGIISADDRFSSAVFPAIRALVGTAFIGAIAVAVLAASPWLGDSDAEKRRAHCGAPNNSLTKAMEINKVLEARIAAYEEEVKRLQTTPAVAKQRGSRAEPAKVDATDLKPRTLDQSKPDGVAIEKLRSDIETTREKTEERINRWGTMFAWLIALAAIILSLMVWMAQAASEDSRRRLEALDQKLTLENRLAVGQAAAKLARAGSRIQLLKQTLSEANREWQFVNKLHRLIGDGEHSDASDFDPGSFTIYLKTVDALDLSILDRELIRPRVLESAVRSLADFLAAVGDRPWLSLEWPNTVAAVYSLANKLSKM